MEVAWHLVNKNGDDFPSKGFPRFASVYPELSAHGLEEVFSNPEHIYVGDEFCPARLPTHHELSGFLGFADKKGLSLTLLTPVLTDQAIVACTELFDCLYQWNPSAEVVVNDLGVLFYLKKNYPDFQLSMGRLFNKGFKDPRLESKEMGMSNKAKEFLNHCSFKGKGMQTLAENLDIHRFEQDLLPHADPETLGVADFKTSVYFPLGYVTTGRACFTAGLVNNPNARFKFNNGCSSPCTSHGLKLKHPDGALELFQNGNTIFYLYTLSMMKGIFKKARSHGFRMVYQGALI